MSENAGKMQMTGKFQRGQSGNPKGKIKGTKNKATLAAELLLKGEVEYLPTFNSGSLNGKYSGNKNGS